jgi:hypothetical protein
MLSAGVHGPDFRSRHEAELIGLSFTGDVRMRIQAARDGHRAWISQAAQSGLRAEHRRRLIEDMGIPSGKSKTIAVNLSGKFLSDSRQVRIVTNMCAYWDEAFLAVHENLPTQINTAALARADLAFHGFSQAMIDPHRRQPETFEYRNVLSEAPWNPTAGSYTRYGDVRELVASPDDRFVIMGSGDELQLRFQAPPPPRTGWKRDFLLYVDGWAKDSDANTAFSQSVEPLPFHGMSQYPYPATEHYPRGRAHTEYRKRYNTRGAAQLVRAVAP